MLLYLVKHSRTKLYNAVRELSKCIDKANMIHYKHLLCAIKYLIYTKDYCYRVNLDGNINGPWEIHGYSDVDYAGDSDTRKSVTGYIVLSNGEVTAWRSQSQKTVTLSVKEAEYSVITEVCCEILFICAVSLFMGVVVEYLITLHIDNVGSIFLSDQTSSYQGTKHIYIHHHFIWDYIEAGKVKIEFSGKKKA